jgi:hypothetical protein
VPEEALHPIPSSVRHRSPHVCYPRVLSTAANYSGAVDFKRENPSKRWAFTVRPERFEPPTFGSVVSGDPVDSRLFGAFRRAQLPINTGDWLGLFLLLFLPEKCSSLPIFCSSLGNRGCKVRF